MIQGLYWDYIGIIGYILGYIGISAKQDGNCYCMV